MVANLKTAASSIAIRTVVDVREQISKMTFLPSVRTVFAGLRSLRTA